MGTEIGKTANSIFGTKAGINTRVNNPLLGQSKMTTIDNSKNFDSTVQCASNSKAVGITFLPMGGNDYRLIIKQDTNLDQTFDYTYDSGVLGRSVSGICNNGVVMCSSPGTWNNCTYFTWDTSDKKIFLRQVANTSSELGGCYCSNSSCGVNTLEPQMYETVGGGVSAAIMAKNPLFIHSKSQWSPTEMTYYLFGQNRTNCTGGVATNWDKYGQKNPTQYYDAQVPPNTSIADVAIEQGSDPTSYYSMISHQNQVSYDYAGDKIGMPTTSTCTINNLPKTNLNSNTISKSISNTSLCVDNDLILTVKADNTGMASFLVNDYFGNNGSPNCGGQASKLLDSENLSSYMGIANGNYYTVNYNISLAQVGGSCAHMNASRNYIQTNGATINVNPDVMQNLCAASGAQIATINGNIAINIQSESMNTVLTDGCNTQENDSSCTVTDESICDQNGANCVTTIRNGIKTGIIPNKMCYTISTSVASYLVCTDGNTMTKTLSGGNTGTLATGSNLWYTIKRTYSCKAKDIAINTNQMQATLGTVQKNDSTSVMTYTDVGGISRTAQLPTGDNCPNPVCTIKRPKIDTSAFSDNTNRSQTVSGTGVYETVIKTCTAPDTISAKTCPVDSTLSEQMIENCSCTGGTVGFQKAITTLEVVDKAAKDMICSQD